LADGWAVIEWLPQPSILNAASCGNFENAAGLMTSRWYIAPAIAGTAFIVTLLLMMGGQGGDAMVTQSARALVHSSGVSDLLKSPRAAESASFSALRKTPVVSPPQTAGTLSVANEVSGPPRNPAEELAPPPPDESQRLVPVLFKFDAGSGGAQIAASVRNMSGRPLDLKVAATDPSGSQTVVQVVIPPHGTEDLATQGLVVNSASVLTVQSPPYLERSVTVQ
jgi:hypothetical protein